MDQVIFRDGLGERRRLVHPANAAQLDVLCIDSRLASIPAFEAALRARMERLAGFEHPQFAALRGVERVGESPFSTTSTLAIASVATPGLRLCDLLAGVERKALAFDTGIAVYLIRQLVAAVAALHESGDDLSHGAIALERLVVTPDARLVVVEHMLGPAIEELQYSHAQLWEDLRVAAPRTSAPPQLDQRSDVMQLGLVALSLILARPITDEECPGHIQDLVATAWAVSARGHLEPVPAGLRAWLGRAVQLDLRNSFASAIDARTDLNKMFGADKAAGAPVALRAFLAKPLPAPGTVDTPRPAPAVTPTPRPQPESAVLRARDPEPIMPVMPAIPVAQVKIDTRPPEPLGAEVAVPHIEPSVVVRPPEPAPAMIAAPPQKPAIHETPRPAPRPTAVASPVAPPSKAAPPVIAEPAAASIREAALVEDEEPIEMVTRIRVQESSRRATAVVAIALIVLMGGGVLATRRYLRPAPSPTQGRLAINTNPDGATVVIDGQPRGVTPLDLTIAAGAHAVELRGQGAPRQITITVEAGAEVSQYIELPKSAPTLGSLHVRSDPTGARVTIDAIPRGVSPLTVDGLAPGEHSVLVEGEAGSARQTVVVEAGVAASLTAQLSNQSAPASGWLSVSAPQEVQLFENGQLVGSSRTDRLMVLAGSHQLELVNQAIGYRATKTVQVAAGKTSTVKVDFPNGTIALNASPWAEVWIDGTRIGETPIGNLPVAVGSHEIVFKHPELGEQKHVTTVTLNAPVRLSVDMKKPQK